MDYFKNDYKETAERAFKSGIENIVMIGTNYKDSKRAIKIAEEIPYAYCSVGWHPHDTKDIGDLNNLLKIMEIAENKKVVAYGEIGLDYFKNYSPQHIQKKFFKYQISIAKELKLPIIIHDREANNDILKILKNEKADTVGGVIHCFSGDLEYAQKVIDMNFYISFPGTITFKKNKTQAENIIKNIPLEKILIETDSPFLTPEPFRGKRNEPMYVKYVAEKIAEIKNVSIEETAKITTENCFKIFRKMIK